MTEETKLHPFDETIQIVRKTALDNIIKHGHRLFSVKTKSLVELFLARLEVDNVKEYKCQTCLDFLHKYGNVVLVDEYLDVVSLLWDDKDVPEQFKKVVATLKEEVEQSRIIGPFYSTNIQWGEEGSGQFQHLNADMSFVDPISEDDADYKLETTIRFYRFLYHVVTSLSAGKIKALRNKLFVGEDVDKDTKIEVLDIFISISEEAEAYKDYRKRDAFLWSKARDLTDEHIPIDADQVSELIETAMSGDAEVALESYTRSIDQVENYINTYLTPTSSQDVDKYEYLMNFIQENGYQESTERRYAKIEEVPLIWSPREVTGKDQFEFPELIRIKWEDFRNEVLGSAARISVAFTGNQVTNMVSVTTASPNSKPIFKWDSLEYRNPLSWYVLNGPAKLWGLKLDEIYQVSGIMLTPSSINPLNSIDDLNGAIFLIEKARPYHKAELGLFDKFLNDDFLPYKTSIREYSKSKKLTNNPEASASGVLVGTNNYGEGEQVFIVESDRQIRRYFITK